MSGQEPRKADGMTTRLAYPRHRFPVEIISHAVWLYHVFSLSLRDVELILAYRGVVVSHKSIRRWCQKFGADFAKRLRKRRPKPGDTWHLDEVFMPAEGQRPHRARMHELIGIPRGAARLAGPHPDHPQ